MCVNFVLVLIDWGGSSLEGDAVEGGDWEVSWIGVAIFCLCSDK